jgi:hypothetical protein
MILFEMRIRVLNAFFAKIKLRAEIIVPILILLSVFLTHCVKDTDKIRDDCMEHDIRDDYIGEWHFKIIRTDWDLSWEHEYGYTSITDTLFFLGSIEYGASSDTTLMVYYLPDSKLEICINEDGERCYFDYPMLIGSSIFFGTDSVYIGISSKALGAGSKYQVGGKKL